MSLMVNHPDVQKKNNRSGVFSGYIFRIKFLITKAIQLMAFYSHTGKIRFNRETTVAFPPPRPHSASDHPILSIVIPAFIRSDKDVADIQNLLNSISRQTQKPHHVIIVDDCSPVVFDYENNVTVKRLPVNAGPAKARNIGKQIALQYQSEIIAFTDSDCILSERWVESITKAFQQEKGYHLLSGNTISFDKHWFGIYHNINGSLNGKRFRSSDRLLYGVTANLAMTREVAEKIHFNENFPNAAGEDVEFCIRANQSGFAIRYVPDMRIEHNYGYSNNAVDSLKQFIRLYQKYGKGEKILVAMIPGYYGIFKQTEKIPAE